MALLAAATIPSARAAIRSVDGLQALDAVKAYPWKAYIDAHRPAAMKYVALYIGGADGYALNHDSMVFRPASTEKMFTAASYAHFVGWDARLTPMLKLSQNEVADGIMVPGVGQGSRSRGLARIEEYVNSLIKRGVERLSMPLARTSMLDELTGKMFELEPYYVTVRSGSGMDGAMSQVKREIDARSRITAMGMNLFLEEMQEESYFDDLVSSLPVGGVDGTLRNRMQQVSYADPDAPAGARRTITRASRAYRAVAAKTGTLANAFTLAGYVHLTTFDRSSEWIPFVVLTHLSSASTARKFIDDLVDEIAGVVGATPIGGRRR